MILHLTIHKFWFILGFKVNTWICLHKRLMGLFVWEEMTLPKLVVIFSAERSIIFATGNYLNSLFRSEMVIFRKSFYSLCFFNWKYNSLFILWFFFKCMLPVTLWHFPYLSKHTKGANVWYIQCVQVTDVTLNDICKAYQEGNTIRKVLFQISVGFFLCKWNSRVFPYYILLVYIWGNNHFQQTQIPQKAYQELPRSVSDYL